MKSRRVRIWAIKTNTPEGGRPKTGKRSYTVRWVVAGREKSRTFVTRALADSFRSDLMQATNQGEGFDVLLKVYAKCIDGEEATVNGRIDEALTGVVWPV